MMLLRFGLVAGLFCLVTILLPANALAQAGEAANSLSGNAAAETAEEKKERITAERFLQLLKRRPRLGTALDKVYGYHVGRGTLEEFCTSLETDAKAKKDGPLWLILGMIQMQRGQDTQAVTSLEKAEELLPKEPLASYYLGKTLLLLGEVDKAAEAMRRSIQRKPARADMLAVFQDLGRIFQRTGRNEEALKVWGELESLFPNDSQVQEEIARILAEEGSLKPAIKRYDTLAKTTKDRFRKVEMAIRSAQLKAQSGQTKQALADFEAQLARVNPESWLHRDIRRRIEEVFWASGDIDGLVNYYTAWVEKNPEDVDAMMRAARFLSIQRRLPEAEKWFRQAIEKAPSMTEPRMTLVEALEADDQYAKAAVEMEALVKIEPDNPDYVVRWGELVFNDSKRSEAQRKSEAGAIWKGLLEKRGDDPITVARVADLLRGSEATEEAVGLYEKAVALAPAEPQYREYLGEFFHQLGRKEDAVKTWRQLAQGDRATRDNLVRLSEVFSTFGYGKEALEIMTQACDMKPTFGHRARYAELLREAQRYDDALAQLDLAEPLAEDPELRELLVVERIKNYQASGSLAKRIDQAQADVEGAKAADASAWQLLALLKEADRKFHAACEAAQKAAELDPGNAAVWETAATLQERSGRFGDAIKSFRKLATLDRRFLSNYLTQIASLEMRLGDTDAALQAGEELIASSPGNAEHYRFFADLCFRVGAEERGFDVLRRSVRSNPNDDQALLYLARQLSEGFRTAEAIELYWRGFDLAKDLDGRTAVIGPLTELYLRTNRFESLTDRLEATGREQNKSREGQLWVAAAHQSAGDLGTAKQMLEQLVREDSRDTKLLKQLVTLARAEYDHEAAAEYQKRLVSIAPTQEDEYLLANILMDLGEMDQSEALWLKLSQRKADPSALINAIGTLVQKEQYETALTLIEKTLANQPDNWEVLAQAMIVYTKLEKKEPALKAASQVLTLKVNPGEPTAKVKQAIQRRASRRKNSVNAYDPYQNLGEPSRLIQAANQIKSILAPNSNSPVYYGGNQRNYQPSCFLDAQAVAYCLPLVLKEEGFNEKEYVKAITDKAIKADSPEELWRAIFYQVWRTPGVQYGQVKNEDYDKCLDRLVEQEEPAAASMRIQSFVNGRQRQTNGDASALEALSTEELDQAQAWCDIAAKSSRGGLNYYHLWMASEFSRADRHEEAEELIDGYIESAKKSSNGGMAMLQAMGVLMSEQFTKSPSAELIAKGRSLFKASLKSTKFSPNNANNGYGSVYSGLVTQLVKKDQLDEAIASVDDVLRWQAEQTAKLRPSQRDRLASTAGPLNYGHVVNGQYKQTTIHFPPPSSYFGAEAIFMVNGLYEACKEDKKKLAKVKAKFDAWADEEVDDQYLRYARIMSKASLAHWMEDTRTVSTTLAAASEMQLGGQFVDLARTRLLYESGKVREALAVVEKLRPSNQRMLVDRELAVLQLVLQLGDLDRAKQSAQRLFALRLSSDTEFKLADLMYQLGMRELGDRMMGRIRRRSGGKQDTLVQLMTRYATAGKNEEAAEIARQVIRRTAPRGSRRSYNSGNQQHEQAVRVLAQTKQLDKLIEQYEKLVEKSPRSTKLADKLAAFYEGAGRREDAQKLLMKAIKHAPTDPRNLLAAGKRLASLNKHKEAAEKFTAAILKSPELLNNEYYEMRDSFKQGKAWGKLADAIAEEGIGKFSQTYRMSEIMSELTQAKEHKAINRILKAGLTDLSLPELSRMMYSISRAEFEIDEEVSKLLEKKLTSKDAELEGFNSNAYIYSRSSNGKSTGFINGLAMIVAQDDELMEKVVKAMEARLEEKDTTLFPRVMLAMVQIKADHFDEARVVLKPLMEKEKKDQNDGQAIWCLASELAHTAGEPGMACDLLESVEDKKVLDRYNNDFEYTSTALLAYAYEMADRKPEARRILVHQMKTMKIDEQQNQYNPGYGEYQYIESQQGLSRRFLKMGYPAEAFIAFRKAFADEGMLQRAKRWGGDPSRRKASLAKEITQKTDAETILAIVESAIYPDDPNSAAAKEDPATKANAPDSDGQKPNAPEPDKPKAAGKKGDGAKDEANDEASKDDDPKQDSAKEEAKQAASTKESQDFAAYLTAPEVVRRSMIDVRVTMPLEEFTLKIAEDKKLKEAITKWLQENAKKESDQPPTLKGLVTLLLISDAVGDADQINIASAAIVDWVKSNDPSTSPSQPDPSKDAPQEDEDSDGKKQKGEGKPLPEADPLPDELLLGMAALRMPEEETQDETVLLMLERALKVAEAEKLTELAGGLRCQIAQRIAESDPKRARDIFRAALDRILPVEAADAEPKTKS